MIADGDKETDLIKKDLIKKDLPNPFGGKTGPSFWGHIL